MRPWSSWWAKGSWLDIWSLPQPTMFTGEVFQHCTFEVLHPTLIIIYFVLLMAISCEMNGGYFKQVCIHC
jgi:hypothetical protein